MSCVQIRTSKRPLVTRLPFPLAGEFDNHNPNLLANSNQIELILEKGNRQKNRRQLQLTSTRLLSCA